LTSIYESLFPHFEPKNKKNHQFHSYFIIGTCTNKWKIEIVMNLVAQFN